MFKFVPIGDNPNLDDNAFFVINTQTNQKLGIVFQDQKNKKWYITKPDSDTELEEGDFENEKEVIAFLQDRRQ